MNWIADKISNAFIGSKVGGYNTKFAAAGGAILAVVALLNLVAQACYAASEGEYMLAVRVLASQEMGLAVAGLVAVKGALGLRLAQDKAAAVAIASATAANPDAALQIADAARVASAVPDAFLPPGGKP